MSSYNGHFPMGVENPSFSFSRIGSSKYNLKDAVKLPDREDTAEWIANNLFYFHKQICLLFGTISRKCTQISCPKMTAGKKYEFLWSIDPSRMPVAKSASDYIQLVLNWVQEQLDDENVFPLETVPNVKPFPEGFMDICKTIARRLFRVYAHIYHHHLREVRDLAEEAHMNTSLKHFIYFVQEFRLVSPNDLEPLNEYIQNLT